jgi:tetratricopeptide (TPR) repeat protein
LYVIILISYFEKKKMKKLQLLSVMLFLAAAVFAQLDLPPSGNNPRATISEEVGITSITIKYSRPDVNKREGKIWGEGNVVTYGFSTQNYITNKNTSPWRAGANENTIITFEHDVKVEGQPLKAGTYGLFMAMGAENVTLIFSNQSDAWGSFYYDEKYDALRANVKPVALDKSVEYLKYEFIEHKEKYCVIAMQWEKLSVPFKVEVDVDNIVLDRLRNELNSRKGFVPALILSAVQYCFNKNINLEEALVWSKRAIDGVGGQKTFITVRNLATAYEKLNRIPEADSTMAEALTIATANQYTAYGRQLITQKRADKAMEIFLASQKRYGDVSGVNNGLMSGYSAKGDFKKAIIYAEKSMALATTDAAKKQLEGNIAKLKEGKDIN